MSIPPGASYQASNTFVKLKRHLLNLEAPVRIQFKEEWKPGNSLHDWYQRHSSHAIGVIELRRERNAPFFHQYIVFKLLDNHFYRIDRRQHPDETTPLGCIYEQGVEAYDTIEEVTSFEDASHSPSDCLVGVEFRVGMPLERILKILWAIHQHSSTRVYTLQRYNCYFAAQTIISLAAKSDQHFRPDRFDNISYIHNELSQVLSTYRIPYNPPDSKSTLPRALFNLFQRFRGCDQGFHNMCLTHFQSCLPCTREKTSSSSPSMTFDAAGRTSNKPNLRVGFSDVILSRVHISLTGFWRHALAAALEVYAQVANIGRVRTEQPVPQLDHVTRREWTRCVRESLQQCAKDLDPIVQRTLDCPTWDLSLTPEMDAEKITHLRRMDNWVEVVVAFFELEYDQLEEAFKAEVQTCLSVDPILDPGLYSKMYFGSHGNQTIPSGLQNKQSKHSLARLWSNRRTERKPNQLKGSIAITQVLNDYLDELIMTHCVRVEQYGRWLKCTRNGVYSDISRTMEELLELVEGFSSLTVDNENRSIFEQMLVSQYRPKYESKGVGTD